MNESMRKVYDALQKHSDVVFGVTCLILFVGVLFLPVVDITRAVEFQGKGKRIPFVEDSIQLTLQAPVEVVDTVLIWVEEGQGLDHITAADYEGIAIEVSGSDGADSVHGDRPVLVSKRDNVALQFAITSMGIPEGKPYYITVHNNEKRTIQFREPVADQIQEGDSTSIAAALGRKKSLIRLLLEKIYAEDLVGHDIAFYFHRGTQIVDGHNPYSCVLDAEESCVGYPAHLPGMYWVAAGLVKLGFDEVSEWSAIWRPIMLSAWLAVGGILFGYLFVRKQPIFAVASAGLWLFNRWSLHVLKVAHVDFLGVLFLVSSVLLAGRMPFVAALLLGISLSIKQVAILVVPVFLIAVWRYGNLSVKKYALVIASLALVPVVSSLPFLIDDPLAVVTGWANVVERPAQSGIHGFAPSLSEWLDITDGTKSLLMIFLVVLVYVSVWRKRVMLIPATLFVFAIMMGFTHVLFNQYFVWFIPFIPLAIANTTKK